MIYTRFLYLVFAINLYWFAGNAQVHQFDNPIALQRADPWVFKENDSTYFFTATVPEYDRIILRKAKSINSIKNAAEKVIWTKRDTGKMSHHIWAPELHKIAGKWFIYFAAGEKENIWNIRMWALSNASKDPMQGNWVEEGRILTNQESFSLDATTFTHKGKRYLIWAQNIQGAEHGTALLISELKNAVSLTGSEVVISKPEFEWERMKYSVNEGPAVIKKNGRIFVTYSASATNHNYCIGLLWINEGENILRAENWNKSPAPVFYSQEELNRYGPGHNSFVLSEDGKTTIMIYHAREYKRIEGHELSDPNRATRARVLMWTERGFPDFRQNVGD